jgi:hypothetical protein
VGQTNWQLFSSGSSVGNKRIDLGPQKPMNVAAVRLNVTSSIAEPIVSDFAVFSPCPTA